MVHRKIAIILLSGVAVSAAADDASTVVVRPREIQDVLVNPGMGVQTFQRFAGQALNEGTSLGGSLGRRANARRPRLSPAPTRVGRCCRTPRIQRYICSTSCCR